MKHTILLILLCTSITLIGMQRPQSTDDQFLDAIRQGNYNQVVTLLDANPILQQKIRDFYNYANEPILKFAKRDPANTPKYMKIARYLVNKGARVADSALAELQAFEQMNKAPAPAYAQPQPVYQQPAPAPAAAPTPLKPAAHSAGFSDIEAAILSRDPRRVEEVLARIDVRTLSNFQQENLFRTAASSNYLYVTNYEQLSSNRKIINALLSKGLKPGQVSADVQKAFKNTVGTRSGLVQTPLTQAIYDGNMSEARRLIMIEKVDVNEPNTAGITPLLLAITRKNSTVAKLLLENGAQTANLFESEQIELKKMLSTLPEKD